MASVDVIVPCYQYGHFLRDCAASVLTQDVSDLRLVIIDNASTDNTLEVARELAAADRRVEVIAHRSNLGHLASFNEGIDWASASYFIVLCADDLLTPGALVRAVSIMERHPEVVLTYGAALVIGGDETVPATTRYSKDAQWRIRRGAHSSSDSPALHAAIFPAPLPWLEPPHRTRSATIALGCRTPVISKYGYVSPALERLPRQCRAGVIRGHAGNRCSSVSDIYHWDLHFEAAFESFFAREGGSLPDANRLRRAMRRALSERAYWGSVTNLLRGNAELSFRLLRLALTRWPTNMLIPPFGYLFRREDAFGRIGQVLSEAVGRLNGGEGRNTP